MSESLSAWMDGELEGEQARQLMAQLKCDGDIRGDWASYHLIGDAIRDVHGPDLSARIWTRLDSEPTVLAPPRRSSVERIRRFASMAAAGVAAVAFVAIVGRMDWQDPQQGSPDIATSPAPELKLASVRVSKDSRDYLLAHQQFSPSNSMQGLGGYVRAMSQEFSPAHRQKDQRKCDCW